ncbi:MAG TPA: glycosyltransferase family 39 protein [Terriglobales bacterium]|nr:glycosyltransferase family 39 protein [Terriglobales bacterium]
MQLFPAAVAPERAAKSRIGLLPISLLTAGFLIRATWACSVFLNADEAMHYVLSQQPSFALTYEATLSTAHPPLFILLLHYWSRLGTSEFTLRLPSLLAGTAFCWILFLWLKRIADNTTALIGLSLALFSPALIYLSAELRQYSLLLFFCTASLYWLDRAIADESGGAMFLSLFSMYLALLTHYSSLIFALGLGLYALLRLRSAKVCGTIYAIWGLGQVVAFALVAFLLKTHVVNKGRMAHNLADSYLRGSIFHRGEDHIVPFVLRANVRVFHFLFSQGAISVVALLLFIAGVVILLRAKRAADRRKPSSRELGFLLLAPFIINCALALGGAYPYGGTRHNSYLALFAMPGVAIALAHWRSPRSWVKPLAIILALALCNLLVVPAGAYIQPKNQRRRLMLQAVDWMHRSLPANAIIFTDLEGALLLSFYYCHSSVVQLYGQVAAFKESPCSGARVIAIHPRQWIFRAENFPADLQNMEQTFGLSPGTPIWVFQAGFVVDKEPDFRATLRGYGCAAPQSFGANILICRIALNPSQLDATSSPRINAD